MLIAEADKRYATMSAGEGIVNLSRHLLLMCFPPSHTAGIRAESAWLGVHLRLERFPALRADPNNGFLLIRCDRGYALPLKERLYSVY